MLLAFQAGHAGSILVARSRVMSQGIGMAMTPTDCEASLDGRDGDRTVGSGLDGTRMSWASTPGMRRSAGCVGGPGSVPPDEQLVGPDRRICCEAAT